MNIPSETVVMIDNTTLYGAKYAFEANLPHPRFWLQGMPALHLRSLMDLIEAIVLYDRIVADSSSREIIFTEENTGKTVVWPKLFNDAAGIFFESAFVEAESRETILFAVNSALTRLQTYLTNGDFENTFRQFGHLGGIAIPDLYKSPAHFFELLEASFSGTIPSRDSAEYDPNGSLLDMHTLELIDAVESILDEVNPSLSSYAMFSFRGFYYQELSNLLGVSYSPHTWRSHLVNHDAHAQPPNFLRYVADEANGIRGELAVKLNSDMRIDAFMEEFPVIATYVAHQCLFRESLLKTAVDVRNSKSVRTFREWTRGVQSSINSQEDLPRIAQATSDLQLILLDIRRELGLLEADTSETFKITIGIPGAAIEIPAKVRVNMPVWLRRILHRRPHLIFLRNMTHRSVSHSPFALQYQQLYW